MDSSSELCRQKQGPLSLEIIHYTALASFDLRGEFACGHQAVV